MSCTAVVEEGSKIAMIAASPVVMLVKEMAEQQGMVELMWLEKEKTKVDARLASLRAELSVAEAMRGGVCLL